MVSQLGPNLTVGKSRRALTFGRRFSDLGILAGPSHQYGLLELAMNLDVRALESPNDSFAIPEIPAVIIAHADPRGARVVVVSRGRLVLIEPSQHNDLFTRHEHEVFWLRCWIVDEGST